MAQTADLRTIPLHGSIHECEYQRLEKKVVEQLQNLESKELLPLPSAVNQINWDSLDLNEKLGYGAFSVVYKAYIRPSEPKNDHPEEIVDHDQRQQQQQQRQLNRSSSCTASSSSSSDCSVDSSKSSSHLKPNGNINRQQHLSPSCPNETHNEESTATTPTPPSKPCVYAIKCISTQHRHCMRSSKHFLQAVRDLANEAAILSRLQHENIITMYGVCADGVAGAYFCDHEPRVRVAGDILSLKDHDPKNQNGVAADHDTHQREGGDESPMGLVGLDPASPCSCDRVEKQDEEDLGAHVDEAETTVTTLTPPQENDYNNDEDDTENNNRRMGEDCQGTEPNVPSRESRRRSRLRLKHHNHIGYFIALNILHETLNDRLKRWKQNHDQHLYERLFLNGSDSYRPALLSKFFCCAPLVRRSMEQRQMIQRREVIHRIKMVALPIARAMKYLHQNRILLRDLKPENVGFEQDITAPQLLDYTQDAGQLARAPWKHKDFRKNLGSSRRDGSEGGTLKLFDFGLAVQILEEDSTNRFRNHTTIDNTMVRAGEIAGSLRYMAPETRLGLGSSMKSDVYSFGILLWELCCLDRPFEGYQSVEEFTAAVVQRGVRPKLCKWRIPSGGLRNLMEQCWTPYPMKRPGFVRIIKHLLQEVSQQQPLPCGTRNTGQNKATRIFLPVERNN